MPHHAPPPAPLVLVIDDSAELRGYLSQLLEGHGLRTALAASAEEALARLAEEPPALVILDWGLPGRDGLSLLVELRAAGRAMPVLMLTARDAVDDRVAGLDAGADDYLAKPFEAAELAARVRALLRRAEIPTGEPSAVGDLSLDPVWRAARRGDRVVPLTQREYALLAVLMASAGRPLSRRVLAERAWRHSNGAGRADNLVDVYVAYLRRKIEPPGTEPLLHTVRGVGYLLRAKAPPAPAARPPRKRRRPAGATGSGGASTTSESGAAQGRGATSPSPAGQVSPGGSVAGSQDLPE
jgi:two-component system response regulator MprA